MYIIARPSLQYDLRTNKGAVDSTGELSPCCWLWWAHTGNSAQYIFWWAHYTTHSKYIFWWAHRAQLRDTSQNPHNAWHTLATGPHLPQALNLTFKIAFYVLYKESHVKVTSHFFFVGVSRMFWTKIGNQFIILHPEDATFIIRTNSNTRSCMPK